MSENVPPDAFDWAYRTGEPVLTLPFVEGIPSAQKAAAMTAWMRSHADRYANKLVKMYHGTDVALPIASEGLKTTSTTRRRSYQSESGYVYLANTPERAKAFGDMGNQGRSQVYEVLVRVRHLGPDKDQLNNQRSVGQSIGNTIGESIVYGGGARVKGQIEPWAVRPITEVDLDVIAKQKKRMFALPELQEKAGASYTFWQLAMKAVSATRGDVHNVDWSRVEQAVIQESIRVNGQSPLSVCQALGAHSPGAVGVRRQSELLVAARTVFEQHRSASDVRIGLHCRLTQTNTLGGR